MRRSAEQIWSTGSPRSVPLPPAPVLLVAIAWIGCSGAGPGALRDSPQLRAEWEQYREAESEDRFDAAEKGYASLCHRPQPFARACYDLSRLLFELRRDREAVQAAVSYVRRFPDDALAPAAIKKVARSFDDRGAWKDGTATLSDLAGAVRGTDVYDSMLYQTAWLQQRAGLPEEEAATLTALVTTYGRWDSQLWDDAMWRLIENRRDQGDGATQKRLLLELLDTREKSRVIGSYNSPYHDDALLMLGQTLLGDGQNDKAYERFMELARLKTSRLRDEGLFWAAESRFAANRHAQGCALLDEIVRRMPRASMHSKAVAKAGAMGCGSKTGPNE